MLKNTNDVVNAVRYAVRTGKTWATFVEENKITRDQIADTAREIAALAYPKDEPVQKKDGKRTRFGNAVQAAGFGMRYVLDKDTDETETERAVNLLTRAGVNATLEDVTAAWTAAQK